MAISAYEYFYLTRIYPGIQVEGIPVGGLTLNEAEARLTASFAYPTEGVLGVYYGNRSWSTTPAELGVQLDAAASAAAAFAIGRSGRLWDDLLVQAQIARQGLILPPMMFFDQGQMSHWLRGIALEIEQPPRDAWLEITDTGQVQCAPAQAGRMVDLAAAEAALATLIAARRSGMVELIVHEIRPTIIDANAAKAKLEIILSAPLNLQVPEEVRLSEGLWTVPLTTLVRWLHLHQVPTGDGQAVWAVDVDEAAVQSYVAYLATAIDRPPQDAKITFDPETRKVSALQPSQEGYRLDTEAATRLILNHLSSSERNLILPVAVLTPTIDSNNLDALGIRELVSQGTTSFAGSSLGRVRNIKIAASKFNGIVIPPGGVFSFNEHLGEVTAEQGYEESLIIWGDRTVADVGGGVCQVSTTAFRAAFWGGFPILERWPHAYRVRWYEPPLGLDATVYAPLLDFRFENDTGAFLYITTAVDEVAGTLTFYFWGTKPNRTVEMEGPIVENEVPHGPPVYEETNELPAGTQKQVEWARNGVDVTVRRLIKQDGVIVRTDVFFSRYKPWAARYLVGTGGQP